MEADFLEDTPEDQIELIITENVNDRDTNFDADHNGDGDHSDRGNGDGDHVDGDLGDGDHSEDGDHGEDGDHYNGDHGAEDLGVRGLGAGDHGSGDHGAGAGDHYDGNLHDYPINQVNQSIKILITLKMRHSKIWGKKFLSKIRLFQIWHHISRTAKNNC